MLSPSVCSFTLRNQRKRAWACAAFAWAAVGLACAGHALARVPPLPPRQAVAVVSRGVIWFNDGPIFLKSFHGGSKRLGAIKAVENPRALVASSASAVAAIPVAGAANDTAFVGGVPPSPLVPIAQPKLLRGGGCKGWLPGGDFVVAGDDLVAVGECQWDDRSVREPLYVRNLRGRHWRVLRWLATDPRSDGEGLYFNVSPILAAEGNLVAVGVPLSSAKMEVSILDVRSERIQAQFNLPDGDLSFAAPDRLVVSVPAPSSPEEVDFPLSGWSGPFHLALYSTRGQRIAGLGSAQEPPLVSGMHLVTDEDQTVSVRSVTGGASKVVISFNSPARALVTLAFRWPTLVVVETASAPLLPSEVSCWSSEYGPAGKPFLRIFDLARSEPFVAAPAPVHVTPSNPLTNCGPAPP
jgi:hypothetical protein